MCTFCRENIGDESFNTLFIWKYELIAALRSKCIPKYYTSNPTIHKMWKDYFHSLTCHFLKIYRYL
jgi:hypothetical protein